MGLSHFQVCLTRGRLPGGLNKQVGVKGGQGNIPPPHPRHLWGLLRGSQASASAGLLWAGPPPPNGALPGTEAQLMAR